MRSSRSGRVLAALCAAMMLAACNGTDQTADDAPSSTAPGAAATPASPSSTTPSATTSAATTEGLDAFYGQKLSWTTCGKFECSNLTVPVDYDKPTGATIKLALLRVQAEGDRKASLVINPGGPGGSGVEYAQSARDVISDDVREQYDVVGFDPRGVGKSAPLKCLTDAQTDALVAADPTPDDDAEVAANVKLLQQLAARCKAGGGALLAHVSTREAARDMDVLRAALGDKKLHYLGKSYGTYLGATYAELFPANVGHLVLDGALDPALTSKEVSLGQAKGFEQATRAFVQDCDGEESCPLGSTVDGGMQRLRDLLSQLDRQPLPTGDAKRPLTEGLGSLGIAVAMYDEGAWPILRDALAAAFRGDGSVLLRLADAYTSRTENGSYPNNQNTVIYAVNCLDRPGPDGTPADVQRTVAEFAKQAPTWGPFLAWSELPCDYWPVDGSGEARSIKAAGSGPIVVVGTTRDPATPYEWAVNLSKQLEDGRLVTYDGDGHTAYRRGNQCVDKAVDEYLLDDKAPKDGLRCS